MTIQTHDFARAPSLHPETRAKLVQWFTRANSQLAEVISAFGLEVSIRFEECTTAWPIDALLEWSDKTMAFRVKLGNAPGISVMALPSPLAQTLIGTLLGDQPKELPADRDLTPAEQSVGEFLVSKIVDSLNSTWTGDVPLDLRVNEREPNLRRTRCFRFREAFIICRATMTTAFGATSWCWLIAPELLTSLFGAKGAVQSDPGVSTRVQLESMAREMTTQVTVRLGGVQLSPPQLAELQVGDLIVLGQKTTEPLRAMVSGKPRFLGWPGRVGGRQAFEIASEGTRLDRPAESNSTTRVTIHR